MDAGEGAEQSQDLPGEVPQKKVKTDDQEIEKE